MLPLHEDAAPARDWAQAKAAIAALPMAALRARVVSAHVMGGCPMGPDPRQAVVDERGRHHHLANLSVHDGSVFPTSIGANPQLTIYAHAARMASDLAGELRPAVPVARAAGAFLTSRRSTLPTLVFGSSFQNSTILGSL